MGKCVRITRWSEETNGWEREKRGRRMIEEEAGEGREYGVLAWSVTGYLVMREMNHLASDVMAQNLPHWCSSDGVGWGCGLPSEYSPDSPAA